MILLTTDAFPALVLRFALLPPLMAGAGALFIAGMFFIRGGRLHRAPDQAVDAGGE